MSSLFLAAIPVSQAPSTSLSSGSPTKHRYERKSLTARKHSLAFAYSVCRESKKPGSCRFAPFWTKRESGQQGQARSSPFGLSQLRLLFFPFGARAPPTQGRTPQTRSSCRNRGVPSSSTRTSTLAHRRFSRPPRASASASTLPFSTASPRRRRRRRSRRRSRSHNNIRSAAECRLEGDQRPRQASCSIPSISCLNGVLRCPRAPARQHLRHRHRQPGRWAPIDQAVKSTIVLHTATGQAALVQGLVCLRRHHQHHHMLVCPSRTTARCMAVQDQGHPLAWERQLWRALEDGLPSPCGRTRQVPRASRPCRQIRRPPRADSHLPDHMHRSAGRLLRLPLAGSHHLFSRGLLQAGKETTAAQLPRLVSFRLPSNAIATDWVQGQWDQEAEVPSSPSLEALSIP